MRITWTTGETVAVDIAPILYSRRTYIPLRQDDALFRSLKVSEYGNAIEWIEWNGELLKSPSIREERKAISGESAKADIRVGEEEVPQQLEGRDPTEAEIRASLAEHGGNIVRTARALGLSTRYVLYRLMRKFGIEA